ncbi:hypothetical protein TeGR_g9419, partial [Tetraparma gracilis]
DEKKNVVVGKKCNYVVRYTILHENEWKAATLVSLSPGATTSRRVRLDGTGQLLSSSDAAACYCLGVETPAARSDPAPLPPLVREPPAVPSETHFRAEFTRVQESNPGSLKRYLGTPFGVAELLPGSPAGEGAVRACRLVDWKLATGEPPVLHLSPDTKTTDESYARWRASRVAEIHASLPPFDRCYREIWGDRGVLVRGDAEENGRVRDAENEREVTAQEM